MGCRIHPFMGSGVQCAHAASLDQIPPTMIMDGGGLGFASGGRSLKTSWPIWGRARKVRLLTGSTTTAITSQGIADGQAAGSRQTTGGATASSNASASVLRFHSGLSARASNPAPLESAWIGVAGRSSERLRPAPLDHHPPCAHVLGARSRAGKGLRMIWADRMAVV